MRVIGLCSLLTVYVAGDVYMHNPRGSNNRLNEKSANRNNGNRLFDSQNNNRGGYNVGDKTDEAFDTDSVEDATDTLMPGGSDEGQFSLCYYSNSELNLEWTSQHGCGGDNDDGNTKLNCNMVMQLMCNTDDVKDPAMHVVLKDGRNTDTPDDADDFGDIEAQTAQNDADGRGRHESEGWYVDCENRPRNKGLFLADQKLKGNSRKYTRQNPNGNRRGLECPEERDYYPYWGPSPWMDTYVCSDGGNILCDSLEDVSMNTQKKGKCCKDAACADDPAGAYEFITKASCENSTEGNANWVEYTHGTAAPACEKCPLSRVNHLGNAYIPGATQEAEPAASNHVMKIPDKAGLSDYTKYENGIAKCVLRLRYNISTDDYAPLETFADQNEDKAKGIISPVEQNPTVDIGARLQGLKLAINTNQFGRTFQDRSHAFFVNTNAPPMTGGKIHNLNVRGKRGNIVQTFPSVEYDFVPKVAALAEGDVVHMQWTGSNTHNNGNPAGDGQAGDAGEGTGGTDRQNLALIKHMHQNYPSAGMSDQHFFDGCVGDFYGTGTPTTLNTKDCLIRMASVEYFKNVADANDETKDELNPLLNNAYASFPGLMMKAKNAGTYLYMCTRNNNFSNRHQKLTVTVG